MIVQTIANILLRAVIGSFQASAIPNKNIIFLHLSNTLQESITPISRISDTEISQLMKEGKCFNYKGKGHIILNYLKKTKVSVIIDALDTNNIKNIDQRKE